MKMEISREVETTLADIRRGLHAAMNSVIRDKDLTEGERLLRMVDDRLNFLIRQAKTV